MAEIKVSKRFLHSEKTPFVMSPQGLPDGGVANGGVPDLSFFLDFVIDLLMGLFRGAVFRHGGVDRKQPIKQPTDMLASTMALMGRFPSLMGRFPTLMGRFAGFVLRGRFAS